MNCNTTHYRANSSSVPGDPTARQGIAVVSGLARGIDAAAHRGALAARARTIAVLGSGLGRIYPPEHRSLAARIMDGGRGAVISEFPLAHAPLPRFFPRRNRVISGLSAGTVVVEAAFASGALVTARLALEQGRELYAVPGSIASPASAGAHDLLASGGAHLVTCAESILDELPCTYRERLGLPSSPPAESAAWRRAPGSVPFVAEEALFGEAAPRAGETIDLPPGDLGPDTDLVARHLSREDSVSVDELASRCRLPASRLLAALSALEIRGLAVSLPGNRIARSRP